MQAQPWFDADGSSEDGRRSVGLDRRIVAGLAFVAALALAALATLWALASDGSASGPQVSLDETPSATTRTASADELRPPGDGGGPQAAPAMNVSDGGDQAGAEPGATLTVTAAGSGTIIDSVDADATGTTNGASDTSSTTVDGSAATSTLTTTSSSDPTPGSGTTASTQTASHPGPGPDPADRSVDFTVASPTIGGRSYTIELGRWNIPTGATNPVVTTDGIQAALDWAAGEGYGEVVLPAGDYLIGKPGNDIYYAGIVLASNTHLRLADRATIRMTTNDKWNYCAISITNHSDVKVSGGTIVGDRAGHIATPRPSDGATAHDEGHLICVQSSRKVLVEDMRLTAANGDGILLVGSKENPALDVTIRNNDIGGNRRQGVSIVGAQRVRIENNEIHHTNGTTPQFGIDLEGNAARPNRNVHIVGNHFHNNRGGDVVNVDGRNVYIDGNRMEQGADSRYIDGPIVYWNQSDQTIRHNRIQMTDPSVNVKAGIIGYSSKRPKTNPATTYIHDNVCDGCGFYMYDNADLDIRRNTLTDGYLSFKNFTNLTLIDNHQTTTANRCWAFRFLNVEGRASGNTFNDEAFEIPIQDPWTYCWQ